MTFPGILLGLLAIALVACGVQHFRTQPVAVNLTKPAPTDTNYAGFILVLAAVLAYVLLAETVGFVLICFVILLALSLWMGAKPMMAFMLATVFPLVIYQLFAHLLRVPLPQGWLGW